jgi:Uncharacterized protein conserved in bacteria
MTSRLARALLLTSALALSACGSLDDIAPKAEKPLPAEVVSLMEAKGMKKDAPILLRIFKEEGVLEVWKQTTSGRYGFLKSYEICKWSGKLGPKYTEGDRQAPEGFYTVRPQQMNPYSNYHLAFNIGFPNAYDRANGRTGSHLMVHGACSSAGCYSMTDEQVEEIYAFARDAFRGGQQEFQIQAFPFRMTPQNMARYRDDPNFPFWQMLKEGYDHFEITRMPPKVDVCERRYVFNRIPAEGYTFDPAGPCPPSTQPQSLMLAYQAYKKKEELAFKQAVSLWKTPAPKASIQGIEEAMLVADWSRRRARGEKVTPEPPTLVASAPAKPESAPVSAYAAPVPDTTNPDIATGAVPPAAREVGAPALTSGALPSPAPRAERAEGEAPSAAESSTSSRLLSRLGKLFGD